MTDSQLIRATEAHRKALARADELLRARDVLIADHLGRDGYTHARLSAITGLSNGSINRIAQRAKEKG